MAHQGAQPPFLGGNGCLDFGTPGLAVGPILQIDHLLYLCAAFFIQAIKPTPALASGVTIFNHFVDDGRHPTQRLERIIVGQGLIKRFEQVRHQIKAHQIHQPKNTGFRHTGGGTEHGIGDFHVNALFYGDTNGSMQPVSSNSVGDKSRRVLAIDEAFSKPDVNKFPQPF